MAELESLRETALYPAVKSLLVSQGYDVKSEIGSADVVGVRADEPPVIVELKLSFSLALFHQGIDRQAITDNVYLAVAHKSGRAFSHALKSNLSLCRRLGLGLITVRLRDNYLQIHCDPSPYRPRQSKTKQQALLLEFNKRQGDPNQGGSGRQGLVTAYRQDALVCLHALARLGPSKPKLISQLCTVPKARDILADNYYGWFYRVERGVYDLTEAGKMALKDYPGQISLIEQRLQQLEVKDDKK